MPSPRSPCGLRRVSLQARAPLPLRLLEDQAFALVRRGIVVRQRADAQGRVVNIDAAGPGAYLPLGDLAGTRGSSAAGYAATDALLCVYAEPESDRKLTCLDKPTTLDLLRLQGEALVRVERIADARSRSTVQRRLAALLCALGDTLLPPRQRDTIPALFLKDLAGLIETRHESICRELRRMESRGWISRSSECIALLDRDTLETL